MFVKVVRKCNEKDQARAMAVFQTYDANHEGLLDMEQQSDAFQALGLVDADGRLPRRSHGEMEGADLRVFLGIIERFKKSSLVTLRKNQGFTSVEVFELNSLFKNFDEDHDGHITKQELVGIIEVLFPLEARSKQFRPFLVQLLQEEEDCAPRSFSDFLVVMRKITDQQEQLEFERQTELIAQLGFSHAEASQFRDLFIMADEDSVGRLSFDQIKRMLCKSLRLSDLHLERLRTIFQQTLLRSGIRNEKAGYAEFLQIMSEVVQEDWCSQLP
ncbi:Troponin C [Durusdinium trenchii]